MDDSEFKGGGETLTSKFQGLFRRTVLAAQQGADSPTWWVDSLVQKTADLEEQ